MGAGERSPDWAGDVKAARQYFESAVRLSADRRYVREFDLFRKRNAVK